MNIKFFTSIALLVVSSLIAQRKVDWGTRFDVDTKNEQDLQLVMKDNYNYYLASVVNHDGMLAQNQVIIRKFDQKNQIVYLNQNPTQSFRQSSPLLH